MGIGRRLGPLQPRNLPLKKAWRVAIQATRDRKRRTGQSGLLSGMSELEQIRGRSLRSGVTDEELCLLKNALGQVYWAKEGSAERDHALSVLEDNILRTICAVQRAPIPVEIEGWSAWLGQDCLERLLGVPVSSLEQVEVSTLVGLLHRVDGQNIGGATVRLRPRLSVDVVLPAIPRSKRDRSPRGRMGPWLEVIDDESRFSLTPQSIAEGQAGLFQVERVIDAFGGVGGNTVALAQRGIQVICLEPVEARVQMARRNVNASGLGEQVDVVQGRVESHLSNLLTQYPTAGLFIDPPWGGQGYRSDVMSWESLLAHYDGLEKCIQRATQVVLKLPTTFDLDSLPRSEKNWSARLEWVQGMALPKFLTVWSSPNEV